MTAGRLVHREDLPVVVQIVDIIAQICDARVLPAIGRAARLAPIETTGGPNVDHLTRREDSLTEGLASDLRMSIVTATADPARSGRKLIVGEHTVGTVVLPRTIGAMMTRCGTSDSC